MKTFHVAVEPPTFLSSIFSLKLGLWNVPPPNSASAHWI